VIVFEDSEEHRVVLPDPDVYDTTQADALEKWEQTKLENPQIHQLDQEPTNSENPHIVLSDAKFAGTDSQHAATHCNTLQYTATHCITLQHTATHCNTLQHTATHCNTLQQE